MRVIAIVVLLGAVIAGQQPPFEDVMTRVHRYVADFEQRFNGLVSEERYVQQASQPAPAVLERTLGVAAPAREQRRVLRSDFLLVQLTNRTWTPFRDVFEVDGQAVRDRENRLTALFLKPSQSTLAQALRITDDSTRYNLGEVKRSINVPTFGLMLMRATDAKRFQIRRAGQSVIAKQSAWRIDFRETARPTMVRTFADADLPVTGSIWVEPATGVVLRTSVRAADHHVRGVVTVTFGRDGRLNMWVPVEMEESYESGDLTISAKASYSNYRRFQVSTTESMVKPPGS